MTEGNMDRRTRFGLLAAILAVAGLGLGVIGANRLQPTTSQKVVGMLEQMSGVEAPDDLKGSRTKAYGLLAGGAVLVVGGVVVFATKVYRREGSAS